jgi:hypothetical protein
LYAGQWKYGTDSLKLSWAQQPAAVRLLQASASHKRLMAAVARKGVTAMAGKDAPAVDVLRQMPADPATGRLPMLHTAEQLHAAFWNKNIHGKNMLMEVSLSVKHIDHVCQWHACLICS